MIQKRLTRRISAAILLLLGTAVAKAQPGTIVIKPNEIKAVIQPTMWGIFFEDINQGADGGLYAELVKNRSFEFDKPMMGWTVRGSKVKEGDALVINQGDVNSNNPRFLRITARQLGKGDFNLINDGFRGMGIKKGLKYDFSVNYRQKTPGVTMHVELINASNRVLGETTVKLPSTDTGWQKQKASFVASDSAMRGRLNIWFEGSGVADLDMISLFPTDTWKGRPGGMRADMVQLLADMKPGFIRFPGGCIVEGFDLSQRYRWKNTVGPLEQRQLLINRWNFEFAHRPSPDYFQTFGLGFFEYFQLADDIGAEALPILNCGMACQFNTAEVVPLDELDPYVQDALDLIEFANGDVTTKWGKLRAEMGHPASFNLKMMGVGNENWGPQYVERLKIFTKAIKAKYPDFKLVNSSGTDPNGDRFDYLNTELRAMNADIIDEHYYRRPEWFMENAARYDDYPRNASKIFAGEYAAQSDKTVSIQNKNNWLTALSEAAFMTGLERNADVVSMASYAPLFAHVDAWQWTPDLIWVDNLRSYGTPDYHVQKLFSVNKGTQTVSILENNAAIAGKDSIYAAASIDGTTKELIIKLVNVSDKVKTRTLSLSGLKKGTRQAQVFTMQNNDPAAMNSLDNPDTVVPVTSAITVKGNTLPVSLPKYSFTVMRIKL